MAAAKLLFGVALLTTLSCVASASQNPTTDIDTGEFIDMYLGVLYIFGSQLIPR